MKYSMFFIAAMCMAAVAFSQQTEFGVRAGANISNWNVSSSGSDLTTSSIAGLEAGLLADLHVSRSFSIQPEIIFSMYGSKIKSGGAAVEYRANYLNIPVLAKYHLPQGVAFFAGPQLGMLLSAKGKLDGEDKQDIKNLLTSTDVFAVIGVEYNSPIGVSVGLRYNHGLTNIYEQEAGNIKNSSFGISFGYKLKTRQKKASR
jgi:Outer membrane protein beta-barrel domain